MGRGRGATLPAWMTGGPVGAPGAPAVGAPDLQEAVQAAFLGEQEQAMRQVLIQQSGQKRSFGELQADGSLMEDPAATKVNCLPPLR